ncbi:MAG: DUF2029 domain-containing protein [Chloroflexi bacterium]|nr:DUF2029 domain-containing protein [Chloroflexota bacterium]
MTGLARQNKALIALGLLLEAGLLLLLLTSGIYRGSYLLEIFFWLPFAIYLLTIWWISRTDKPASLKQTSVLVLLFALVFQVTLLFSPNPLSDDIYRYNWDGKVFSHGLNPYADSPDAEQLQPLIDANWEKVQNRNVHTFYPPLSQLVFAAGYLISPSPFTLRLFSVLFYLLSIGVLILILKELRLDERYSIAYAWSPLATIEFANSGHIDSLAILLTLLSFFALLKRKSALSSAALGLGVLAKFYPLLFAGLFLPRWGRKGALVFAGVTIACYLPFLGAGAGLFQGFSYFMGRGLFNGSLFPLVSGVLGTMMEKPDALLVSKALVGAIFLGFLAYLLYLYSRSHQQEGRDLLLLRYSFWLVGAFLLLSPTVHPWYLTWVLPFLCFFRSAGWILLTGTVILARSIYIGYEAAGTWQEMGWVRLVEYGPPYLLMLYGLVRRWRKWRLDPNWNTYWKKPWLVKP